MAKLQADGTIVKIGQGNAASTAYGADTFVEIGEVTDIDLGGMEKALTTFRDLQDTLEQYVPNRAASIGDSSLTVEFDWGEAGNAEIIEAFNAGELRWIEITLADATVIYASAYITNLGNISGSVGDKVTRTYGFRTTIAWTAA